MSVNEQDARANLKLLIDKYNALTEEDRDGMTEAGVVRQFIDLLLRDVLGWPIEDPARHKYEKHTAAGRPDLTLIPEKGGVIFVEAKRFGKIKELEEAKTVIEGVIKPQQMSLPGMAIDRTEEEQQAINYAFKNGWQWAILTNFEKLRLFNARRDWLVLSFERPAAYLQEFDELWQLAYPNVVNGTLEQLSNQRYTRNLDIEYLNFINEWRERLAQDIITHPEDNAWAFTNGHIHLGNLREVVQRFLDRLVIIRFAEDHYVLTPGSLRRMYEYQRDMSIYTFTMQEILSRYFRRFDDNHNSALFAPGLTDQAVVSDAVLAELITKLYEARYRAMPADIIGNTYEQYLGKTLALDNGSVTTRDNLETRKKQGSYYTPQVVVQYIVDNSLGRFLYGTHNGKPDGDPLPGETRKTSAEVKNLRVLDAACGSGSFLIYAYYVLEGFYQSEIKRLEQAAEARRLELVDEGTTSPLEISVELTPFTAEIHRIQQDYPRLILETHLYGVDLDPQAAEIAVVNLMMRAMEGRHQDKRLPLILNQNVKVGNALIGAKPDDPRMTDHAAAIATVRRLRLELVGTPNTDPRHDDIIDELRAAESALQTTLDAPLTAHFSDLERVRPLHWGMAFPEVFFDEDGNPLENPGFDVIIGNPPWEIVKPDLREFYAQYDADIESRLNRKQVEARIEELNTADPRRESEWQRQTATIEESAAYYRTSDDYARQGRGDTATHKLFTERAYDHLLSDGGRLGYVIPSGIYTDLGTKPLREMLLDEGSVQYIYSFSNERFFFPGVDHRFKFALVGANKGGESDGFWAAFRFNPRVAISPDDFPAFVADDKNLVYVKNTSVEKYSPDSLSFMEFKSQLEADIVSKMFEDVALIGEDIDNAWHIKLNREFDMTNDRKLFNRRENGYPLYEGKMIHQYDSQYAEPQYWVSYENAEGHFRRKKSEDAPLDYLIPRLGFREITFATNERTLIATIIPPNTCCNHKISVASPRLSSYQNDGMLYSLSILNSLTLDFVARLKITSGMSMFHFYQLPLPRLNPGNPYFDALVPRAARLTCTRAEFADLWQDVMGEAWDESKGATNPAQRQTLRDEIDALVAHLYGLSRTDFDHILRTFPLVFPDDETGNKKRETLLEIYDEFTPTVAGWSRE